MQRNLFYIWKKENKVGAVAGVLIAMLGITLGYWFVIHQMQAISPTASSSYPSFYFIFTLSEGALTLFIFFSLSWLILKWLSAAKLSSLAIAATYSPVLLLYLNSPLYGVALLVLFLQLVLLLSVLKTKDYLRLHSAYTADVLAFTLLFLMHLFLTTRFSPLHWKMALLVHPGMNAHEIPMVSPLFKSYALAKQFVFSSMDYSQWAGIMNPPITLASPFLQLLTLLADLPNIDPVSFNVILMTINFVLIVGGSFGFYLFLKHAAKSHFLFAWAGGCLFFFSGSPLLDHMLRDDGGVFLSPYAIFPYALLLISFAYEKKNYYLAAWAGAALASPFFFMTPHPEGTIYSLLFYLVYALGLMIFTPSLRWTTRLGLTGFSALSFFLLSAFNIWPILYDSWMGYMHTFAHVGDVDSMPLTFFIPYFKLVAVMLPLSFLLLFLQKKLSVVYLSSVFLLVFLLSLILLTSSLTVVTSLVNFFHIGVHIWLPWRVGMYFCLMLFTITLLCLEAIAREGVWLTAKRIRNLIH